MPPLGEVSQVLMAGWVVMGTQDGKEGLLGLECPQTLTQARGLPLHPSARQHPWGGVKDGFPSPGGWGCGLAEGPSPSRSTRDCPHPALCPRTPLPKGSAAQQASALGRQPKAWWFSPPGRGCAPGSVASRAVLADGLDLSQRSTCLAEGLGGAKAGPH